MSAPRRPLYQYLLPFFDWLTIVGTFVAAIVLRGRDFRGEFGFFGTSIQGEILFLCLYSASTILVFHFYQLYRVNVFTSVADHSIRILKSLFVIVLGLSVLAFFTRARFILDSRLAIVYFATLAFLLMMGGRVIIFRAAFLFLTGKRMYRRKVLIVGAGDAGKNLAVNLYLNQQLGLDVQGFLDDELPLGKAVFRGQKVLGRIIEIREIIKIYETQEILVCLQNVDQPRFLEVLESAVSTGLAVKVFSPLYDIIPARMEMEKYGSVSVVNVSKFGPSPAFVAYKRVFDALLAGIGILLLSPLLIMISVLIKLDSPGSIIFSQLRVGKDGVPFKFYKFRSMAGGSDSDPEREAKYLRLIQGTWDGHSAEAPMKIIDESRITRVGRMLRQTSLDELPQLFNVLKGDMSLVGPRPCLPYEWKHYQEWHKRRLSVMPGCTGVWQVFGRSEVGFQDMVVLDLFYSQNASIYLDLWLLLKTIPVMVLGRGGK